MSLFQQTKRFQEAAGLINKLDSKRLPLLIARVLQALAKAGQDTMGIFSGKEEQQLLKLFAITKEQLATILNASSYIFEQAAYHSLNSDKLTRHLAAAKLEEAQAQAFGEVWAAERDAFLVSLKKRSLGAPQMLDNTSWRLQLTMGQQTQTKTKDLNAIFNFNLRSADAEDRSGDENLAVEFNEESLLEFYDAIEKVQTQLDGLSQG